jgi:DNA-binding CsgD family transcriptional regulator
LKQSKGIAHLRQLCCSGLSKEIVIPEFLRAVQTVLQSSNNTFTGFSESFTPSYFMLGFAATEMDEHTPRIISQFFTPECRNRLSLSLRQQPVITSTSIFTDSYYLSDLYNLVCRQYDQHHVLYAVVAPAGKPIGTVNLFRSRQQKSFDNKEQALMTCLLPYVTHALQAPDTTDVQYCEKGSSGMMIMDTGGKILYLSQEAKKLLALASHPLITVNMHIQEVELLAKLGQLCRNLGAIFRGQHAAPPSWSYINGCGQFVFHAQWLQGQNSGPNDLIGITIVHQEPQEIKILRILQGVPLSPVQKEVAALLAQGFSSEKIGERLHIKLNTVKDHISKIFTKLDINHREELLPLLLSFDSSISNPKVL